MSIWLYSFLSIFLVSLLSLIGIFFLALKKENLKKISLVLIGFAVGGLLGDAFIHLLPESFKDLGTGLVVPILVIFGIIIFFSLEKFLRWRHCHDYSCDDHKKHFVAMNLIGDTVHNLIDGMLIAASYFVSIPIGIATTLAILLHEIPQEIGDFSIFIHGGVSVKRAIFFNFLSAAAGFLGALIAMFLGPRIDNFSLSLLPIAAGGFLYIAGSDLIPELHHETKIKKSILQLISIMLGVGLMALLVLI